MPIHQGTRPLETVRLHLRRFVPTDDNAVYDNWASDPEVARFLTWKPHSTRKVTHDMVESWCSHYTSRTYHWAIVWRKTGEVIGSVSLVRPTEEVFSGSIAYALSSRFWGMGIVPEAATAVFRYLFDSVGLCEIYGQCDMGNTQSERVMEKLSMTRTGTETGTFTDQQGNPRTVAEYRIARQEWETPVIRHAMSHETWSVGALYAAVADSLHGAKNGPGWIKHLYPRTETAVQAHSEGELFVFVCAGKIEGTMILNTRQDSAYRDVEWLYPAGGLESVQDKSPVIPPALVIHTLAVHPAASGRGVGQSLLAFAERFGCKRGCPAIRLDTYIDNLPAIRLYEKCGYRIASRIDLGIAETFGLYWFYALEKPLALLDS